MSTSFVPEPEMPLPAAMRLYLLDRLSEFQRLSDGLTDPDRSVVVEAVHDLRVICRQILSVLDAFSPWMRMKRLRPVKREIRRINGFLGPVRDLDILLTHPELPPHGRVEVERQRSEALAALEQACSGRHSGKSLARIIHLLSESAVEIHLVPVPITGKGKVRMDRLSGLVPAVLFRLAAAITAYRGVITGSATGSPPPEVLHQLRIQCKTFRYTTSMLRPLLGQPADDLIRAFKRLQDLLGAIHDHDLLIWALSQEVKAAPMDSSIDAALLSVRQKRDSLIEEFLAVWNEMNAAWFARRIVTSIMAAYPPDTEKDG